MFHLIFDENAISFLEKLNQKVKERIFKKLIAAKENPQHFLERLSGRTDYKMRVGNYRIIAGIESETKTIHVTLIGHRKNVYEKKRNVS
ncbi:MAG: type II toxin-antitoxin system RelE/ParE family toxin [Nanoarchaeota archaeon]